MGVTGHEIRCHSQPTGQFKLVHKETPIFLSETEQILLTFLMCISGLHVAFCRCSLKYSCATATSGIDQRCDTLNQLWPFVR
jgi:hypothetical protein